MNTLKTANQSGVLALKNRCLSRANQRRLRTMSATDGNGNAVRFRSLSVGFGASAAAIVGLGADAGWIFDLDDRVGPRVYSEGAGGVGAQALAGVDAIMNLSVDPVAPGVSKYSGIFFSVDAGIGVGVGMITERSKRMANARFKGLELAFGLGVGAGYGSKYSVRQRQWRKACKNATLKVTNNVNHEIKIYDVDYWDSLKRKWRSEPIRNKKIKPGATWRDKRWFGKVGDEQTRFKIKYKKRKNGSSGRWIKHSYTFSPPGDGVCRNGRTYSATIGS